MALVKCPECGKENVSDSAEMCPECGYGIKAHFDLLKQKQLNQEIYQWKLDNVKMPEKPRKNKFLYGLAILSVIAGLYELFILPVIAIIMFLYAWWMYYEGDKQYKREMERYNLALTDFEKYQKEFVREEERRAFVETLKPKCPSCGSTNIQRITTLDRAASFTMVGMASGKIGKQYKCKKCGHMW